MHYFFRFSNADRFSLPPNTGYIRCNCDVGVPENSRRFEPCPRRIRCGKIWVQTYDEMFMPKQQKKQLEAEMDESMIGSQVSGGEELLGDELGDEEQSITSSLISMKKREKEQKALMEKMGVILPLALRYIILSQCAHAATVPHTRLYTPIHFIIIL